MGTLSRCSRLVIQWQASDRPFPERAAATVAEFAFLTVFLVMPLSSAAGQSCNCPPTNFNCSCPPSSPGNQSGDGNARGATGNQDNRGNQGDAGNVIPPSNTVIPVWWPPRPDLHPECSIGSPGDYERRLEKLDNDGPQMPAVYGTNRFSIMGFSRGGWPVVIDYVLEQAGRVLLVIAPDGRQPQVFVFNSPAGHQQAKIPALPGEMGDDLRVSQYLVQMLDSGAGPNSPLHVRGVAAGPKAVGSIGIDQVGFGPTTIQVAQHQKAQYSFHAIRDFKKTGVTFIRLTKSADGEIIAAGVGDKSNIGPVVQNGSKKGEWDGIPKPQAFVKKYPPELQRWLSSAAGEHILQVRGWFGVNEGGDWVFASSDTRVLVQ